MLAYGIIIPATAGVIVRPFRLPEAVWALAGAAALVAVGVLPWIDALGGVAAVGVVLCLLALPETRRQSPAADAGKTARPTSAIAAE